MSEAKHTPGPWFVDRCYNGSSSICQMRHPDKLICINAETGATPVGHEATDANARLIAAAPNLLAMLKRCVKYVPNSAVAGELIMTTSIDECRIRTLAEKLIAQVEGRSE